MPFRTGGLMQLVAVGAYNIYEPIDNTKNNYPYKKRTSVKNKQQILKEIKFKNFRKNDKYDQRKCVVCLGKFKVEEFVVVRMCRHIYHKDCNDKSMIECPICRQ